MPRKSKLIVSVVTADIVHSTHYSDDSRRKINTVLKKSFDELVRTYPDSIYTPLAFRITAGDEFQCVFSNVAQTLDLLIYLRCSVAISKVRPLISFRASIGIGGMSVKAKSNPYEQDGEAFVRARRGLEQLAKRRQRLTKLITDMPEIDSAVDIVLLFLDRFQKGWTRAQWEAVKWSLLGLTREEIARKLDVAHQNVTKRLTAAGWQEFKEGTEFIRELLEKAFKP